VEVQLQSFLTSALDGGEWSASQPALFTPRERAPGTHWIGGWVGSRAVLDAVVKRKIASFRRKSNPRPPIFQPVAQRKFKYLRTVASKSNQNCVHEEVKKWRTYQIWGMLPTILFEVFCLLVPSLKAYRLRCKKRNFTRCFHGCET
jgi:hypothetical protein